MRLNYTINKDYNNEERLNNTVSFRRSRLQITMYKICAYNVALQCSKNMMYEHLSLTRIRVYVGARLCNAYLNIDVFQFEQQTQSRLLMNEYCSQLFTYWYWRSAFQLLRLYITYYTSNTNEVGFMSSAAVLQTLKRLFSFNLFLVDHMSKQIYDLVDFCIAYTFKIVLHVIHVKKN